MPPINTASGPTGILARTGAPNLDALIDATPIEWDAYVRQYVLTAAPRRAGKTMTAALLRGWRGAVATVTPGGRGPNSGASSLWPWSAARR